jgi:hypothetical protein
MSKASRIKTATLLSGSIFKGTVMSERETQSNIFFLSMIVDGFGKKGI